MATDTATLSYWLNWRFFVCALWVLSTMTLASFLIWKYEGVKGRRRNQQPTVGCLHNDEVWETCLQGIHPIWLLAYRVIAFIILLGILIANLVIDGGGIFYFYTQWTFALVTIYFGVGSSLSIYRCCHSSDEISVNRTEQGNLLSATDDAIADTAEVTKTDSVEKQIVYEPAGVWGYSYQIIFQMSAGASMLTDIVFWFVLYPTNKHIGLNFLIVSMHSINAILLLGDAFLNCLRFPLFRFAYFILWTGVYIIFQWIIHACVSTWWPYPFLDLSSPYAPLWYLGVGLLHIPCYAIFALVIRLKNFWFSRSFPQTYRSFG